MQKLSVAITKLERLAQKLIYPLGGIRFSHVERRIASIEGLLVPGQEEWLFKAAKALPDGANIVEIGGYKGRSTSCFAFGCLGTNKHIFTIDTFNGNTVDFDVMHRTNFFEEWQQNLRKNDLLRHVTPLVGFSSEVATNWNRPIHLLFIDGSHEYEDALSDFDLYFPYVVAGGIVAMHDVEPNHPGCQKAWDERAPLNLTRLGHLSTLAFGTKPS